MNTNNQSQNLDNNDQNKDNDNDDEDSKIITINPIFYSDEILQKIQNMNYSTTLISDLGISQKDIDLRMKYYFSIPQPPQKSQEWLNQRTNYITASALENAVAPLWSGKRNDLLRNKVSRGTYNSFHGNEATRWGEKYEDVANAIYCYRQKTTVEEFGLIPHYKQNLKFCGASTDGISSRLINLEIKCPFSRRIRPGTVPHHYWKQMQLQMEVLDLEMTHFLECKFQEYASSRDFWIDFDYPMDNPEKGIIIEIIRLDQTNLAGEPKTAYLYSPIHLCESQQGLRKWEQDIIKNIVQNKESHMVYIRSHYWVISVCSCVNVARDREWFQSKIPDMTAFWNDVERYRENGGIEALNQDIEEQTKIKQLEKMEKHGIGRTIDGQCLILESESSQDSTPILIKEEEGYVIISSSEEEEDVNKDNKDKREIDEGERLIISSDSENDTKNDNHINISNQNKNFDSNKKIKQDKFLLDLTFKNSSSSQSDHSITETNLSNPPNLKPSKKVQLKIIRSKDGEGKISYEISDSEDEERATKVTRDLRMENISLKLTKINLQLTERKRTKEAVEQMGVKVGEYDHPTLIITPEHSTNDSSLEDLGYDGDSSGSDTDNDSPPLRPPSQKVYKKRKWRNRKSTNSLKSK